MKKQTYVPRDVGLIALGKIRRNQDEVLWETTKIIQTEDMQNVLFSYASNGRFKKISGQYLEE